MGDVEGRPMKCVRHTCRTFSGVTADRTSPRMPTSLWDPESCKTYTPDVALSVSEKLLSNGQLSSISASRAASS